ncbi:MAG: hypothetical protein LBC74_01995 [Planctomycetaceae bacterium]|nr:hypothetical protein [Planctomycetaceae bacterium]
MNNFPLEERSGVVSYRLAKRSIEQVRVYGNYLLDLFFNLKIHQRNKKTTTKNRL